MRSSVIDGISGQERVLFVLHSSGALVSLNNHTEWLFVCSLRPVYIGYRTQPFIYSIFLTLKYVNRRMVQRNHEVILS